MLSTACRSSCSLLLGKLLSLLLLCVCVFVFQLAESHKYFFTPVGNVTFVFFFLFFKKSDIYFWLCWVLLHVDLLWLQRVRATVVAGLRRLIEVACLVAEHKL